MINLITDHMDIWTSAQTQKTNGVGRGNHSANAKQHGIKKLRELILELAVRGMLVPQDPKDEPASILLKKIAAEKARLIKEGKIKKQEPLPNITEDEKSIKLPEGWEYIRIGNAMNMVNGRAFKPTEWGSSGLRIIRIQNLNDPSAPYNYCDFDVDSKILINDGDFLISWSGTPGTSFGAFIWDRGQAILNQHIFNCELYGEGFFTPYLRLAINAELDEMISQAHGAVGLQHITKGKLENLLITLPPLSEQHRIVAKVDELMAICDQLEQKQTGSNTAHQTLVETLLATLTSATSQDEFVEAWQRIASHFDILFTAEQSIDQLKQTILQLAVMGKLVPQDPNDEPASVLLEKIAKEKTRLIKEGKIKKQEPLLGIVEGEKPFELPEGWEWTRLGNLSANIHYGYTASADHGNSGIRLLRITDIQNDSVNWETVPGCEIEEDKANDYLLENNDILIARTGGTIGKSYLVEDIDIKAVFASYLIRIKRIEGMYSPFIKTYLGSQLYWQQLYENSMGTGQPNVNATALKGLVFPIPPLSEQHRITAKVDELMSLCDTLKARINDAQTTQIQLADAIVEQAVA